MTRPVGRLTGGLVPALLRDVVILADPLAVALEIDLRGREGAAAQLHRLVLHDVGVLRLLQEVGQRLGRRRWEGLGEHLAARISACAGREGSVRPEAEEAGAPPDRPGAHGRQRGIWRC